MHQSYTETATRVKADNTSRKKTEAVFRAELDDFLSHVVRERLSMDTLRWLQRPRLSDEDYTKLVSMVGKVKEKTIWNERPYSIQVTRPSREAIQFIIEISPKYNMQPNRIDVAWDRDFDTADKALEFLHWVGYHAIQPRHASRRCSVVKDKKGGPYDTYYADYRKWKAKRNFAIYARTRRTCRIEIRLTSAPTCRMYGLRKMSDLSGLGLTNIISRNITFAAIVPRAANRLIEKITAKTAEKYDIEPDVARLRVEGLWERFYPGRVQHLVEKWSEAGTTLVRKNPPLINYSLPPLFPDSHPSTKPTNKPSTY